MNPTKGKSMVTIYGQCTNCGCVEVKLFRKDGVQDLSSIGESPEYPFGAGCEVCIFKPLEWRSATAPHDWKHGTTYASMYNPS
jgi:hypothetical protein